MPDERAVASGDGDGDGSDEFLVGTRDSLVCLTEDEKGRGRELWRCHLPAASTNPVIADVDGDGEAGILVSTADGYVRLLGPPFEANGTARRWVAALASVRRLRRVAGS